MPRPGRHVRLWVATLFAATTHAQVLPPAPADADEVVDLTAVEVSAHATAASDAMAARIASPGATETISGRALERPGAQSVSNLLKDTAGVTVSNGADGETRVAIRGLDSRFVRVTVDGQRPGGSRNSLDSLPPEAVQAIQVAKSLTPDQDADAIGGSIAITTQNAVGLKAPVAQARTGLTSAPREPTPGTRVSALVGRPVAWLGPDTIGGFILSANYDNQRRRRENNETDADWPELLSPGPAPFTGTLVPAFTLARHEFTYDHRERLSAFLNADAARGDLSLYFRANVLEDHTRRVRRRMRFDVARGTPTALSPEFGTFTGVPLQRREQLQTVDRTVTTLAVGGAWQHERRHLDAMVSLGRTDERQPQRLDAVFESDHSFLTTYDAREQPYRPRYTFVDETDPADVASQFDPAHYQFASFTANSSDQRDRELSARLNAQFDLNDAAKPDALKFGAKVQQRRRAATADQAIYQATARPFTMAGLVRVPLLVTADAFYRYGPIPNADAVAARLATSPAAFIADPTASTLSAAAGNFDVTETIWAGYGLAHLRRGAWSAIGGVRVEVTGLNGRSVQPLFNADGAYTGLAEVSNHRTYAQVLPSLNARWDAGPGTIVRAAISRALTRPNPTDLLPTRQFSFVDHFSRSGNPDLQPYAAVNYDLSVDTYDETFGLLSAGVFAKDISRFIADEQTVVHVGDLGDFLDRHRINGGSARVTGLELGWKGNALPAVGPFASFTPSLSYTLLDSAAHLADRPGETVTLPQQARHQISATLQFTRGGFSLDLGARYRTTSLESLVAPGHDLHRLGGAEFEVSATQKLPHHLRLTAAVTGLTNHARIDYTGVPAQLKEIEVTGPDYALGLQWKL